MLIVSGSLPKSGSTWLYNMTHGLLGEARHTDVYALRDWYRLHGVLRGTHCEISYATPRKMLRLLPVLARNYTLLAKTHLPPSRTLKLHMSLGLASATYIYRDPRDVALSAMDHGQRAREGGHGHELGRLATVEQAIEYTRQELLPDWRKWMNCRYVLKLKYEDVKRDPEAALTKVAAHLKLDLSGEAIRRVVDKFNKDKLDAKQRARLLMNKGTTRRYLQEMTKGQIDLANRRFEPFLAEMDYAA